MNRDTLPAGLQTNNREAVASKIEYFAINGPESIHVIFDFDRTLTVNGTTTHDDATTWNVLHELLPAEGQAEYWRQYNKYRPIELSGEMTANDAAEWTSSILDLFVQNHINLQTVEERFLERVAMRPGTKELFDQLRLAGIPTVIMSAGVKNVIDIWTRHYQVSPTLTLSTELVTDNNSAVTGWDPSTLIHIMNKHEQGHPELQAIRESRPNTIVIGDNMKDADMASGDDNVLRIRLLDRRADDPDTATEISRTFERFDALITNGSLQPAVELINTITQQSTAE